MNKLFRNIKANIHFESGKNWNIFWSNRIGKGYDAVSARLLMKSKLFQLKQSYMITDRTDL